MFYSDYLIYQFSTFFYYHKKGQGGGQKVMIGTIISKNVNKYGRPLTGLTLLF